MRIDRCPRLKACKTSWFGFDVLFAQECIHDRGQVALFKSFYRILWSGCIVAHICHFFVNFYRVVAYTENPTLHYCNRWLRELESFWLCMFQDILHFALFPTCCADVVFLWNSMIKPLLDQMSFRKFNWWISNIPDRRTTHSMKYSTLWSIHIARRLVFEFDAMFWGWAILRGMHISFAFSLLLYHLLPCCSLIVRHFKSFLKFYFILVYLFHVIFQLLFVQLLTLLWGQLEELSHFFSWQFYFQLLIVSTIVPHVILIVGVNFFGNINSFMSLFHESLFLSLVLLRALILYISGDIWLWDVDNARFLIYALFVK